MFIYGHIYLSVYISYNDFKNNYGYYFISITYAINFIFTFNIFPISEEEFCDLKNPLLYRYLSSNISII